MNKIKSIVVIDDGINEFFFEGNVVNYRIDNAVKRYTFNNDKDITHGTICSMIINRTNEKIELIGINVFSDDNCFISDVIVALEWCLDKNIDYINMSMGSVLLLYKDEIRFMEVCKKLYSQGKFIVSAFSNDFPLSSPAFYSYVIGVKAWHLKSIKFNSKGFCDFYAPAIFRLRIDNNVFIKTEYCNSYAAAYVMNKLAKKMDRFDSLTEIYEYLDEFKFSRNCIYNKRKNLLFTAVKTNKVVFVKEEQISDFGRLKNMFFNFNEFCETICCLDFLPKKINNYPYWDFSCISLMEISLKKGKIIKVNSISEAIQAYDQLLYKGIKPLILKRTVSKILISYRKEHIIKYFIITSYIFKFFDVVFLII